MPLKHERKSIIHASLTISAVQYKQLEGRATAQCCWPRKLHRNPPTPKHPLRGLWVATLLCINCEMVPRMRPGMQAKGVAEHRVGGERPGWEGEEGKESIKAGALTRDQ